MTSLWSLRGLGLAVIVLLLGGCASTAPPTPHLTAQLTEAKTAIEQAEDVDAQNLAPLALRNARQKMEAAQVALADGKPDKAERLAQQAMVDAELAEISARSAKAQETAEELRESIRTLREEIARKQNG